MTRRYRIYKDADLPEPYIVKQWVPATEWLARWLHRGAWVSVTYRATYEAAMAYIKRLEGGPTVIAELTFQDGKLCHVNKTIDVNVEALPSATEVLTNPPTFPDLDVSSSVANVPETRCENCRWWRSGFTEGNFAGGDCLYEGNTVTASLAFWHCRDFEKRR